MARPPTDYNEPRPGRIVRTTKWWFAPQNVTPKARKVSQKYLLILAVALAAALVLILFHPEDTVVQGQPAAAAPSVPPVLVTSECAAAEPVDYLPEQVIAASFDPLWVRDGNMSRPTSPAGGPFIGDPFPRCYARTPEGALYATAAFATGVISATEAGTVDQFFTYRSSHTGNYSAFMAELPNAGVVTGAPQLSISGFRWNNYTPELVSLELRYDLVTGPNTGKQVAVTYTVTWENNDWLQIVPGATDDVTVAVDSNRSYIPWGKP